MRTFCSARCRIFNHRWIKWQDKQSKKQGGGGLTFTKVVKNGREIYEPEFRGRPKQFLEHYSKEWYAYFAKYTNNGAIQFSEE